MRVMMAVVAVVLLSACAGKDTVLFKRIPDPYRAASLPPLTLPPEFTLLPPDEAGPRQRPSGERVRASLLGQDNKAPIEAEDALLLETVGAPERTENIQEILKENSDGAADSESAPAPDSASASEAGSVPDSGPQSAPATGTDNLLLEAVGGNRPAVPSSE